jgi:preprotein translocase subunit SecE
MATKKTKKKKPKGKSLADTLKARDEKRAAAHAELDAEREEAERPAPEADERDEEERDEEERDEEERDEEERDEEEREDEEAERDAPAEEEEQDAGEAPRAAADDEEEEAPVSGAGEEEEAEDETVAAAMGYQRYVVFGFMAMWVVAAYVIGRALASVWSELATSTKFIEIAPALAAVPHEGELWSRESISLMLGALLGGAVVLYYYRRPDVRRWSEEVSEEISKVKWPTRKEIGSYTVIVLTASALLTAYLTLLDRFWAFVTNLIYSSGA